MKRFPAGSEWRKWDLHVHVPGTKLNCGYGKPGTNDDFEEFADILEKSDVAVFGITDYFSVDQTLKFVNFFKQKYPNSSKLLLVNVELRLNETVNKNLQTIDYHVIFNDAVPEAKLNEFLSSLETQTTDMNGRAKHCSELVTSDFKDVSVTRQSINKAFCDTFGRFAEPTDSLIYIVPSNNNGLRSAPGDQRKAKLADEIDKTVHAIFGKNESNSLYFLRKDRYEDRSQTSKPKPVFGGCDAHNFNDLKEWLGKSLPSSENKQVVTWVKADPTFEGLRQTLVEPADRVSLRELLPDAKDPYKVLKRVTFKDSQDFPSEIVLNPNLNAIIGSRSSGKSAFLAHIAHAVDPAYAVKQQTIANSIKDVEAGPAAGLTWDDVSSTVCEVEWADGSTNGGQVIYIPQNWLYQISGNPREVTNKILPVLKSSYPGFFREQNRQLDIVETSNEAIRRCVGNWFGYAAELSSVEEEIKGIGNKDSIEQERNKIHTQLESLRDANSLSEADLASYQALINTLGEKRGRIEQIKIESEQLESYIVEERPSCFTTVSENISVKIALTPDPTKLPEQLGMTLDTLLNDLSADLIPKIEKAILEYRNDLSGEESKLKSEIVVLEADNKDIFRKYKTNKALDELVMREKKQEDSLAEISSREEKSRAILESQDQCLKDIDKELEIRSHSLESIMIAFDKEERRLDDLAFGIEIDFDPGKVQALSEPFRKNLVGTFLKNTSENGLVIDIDKAQSQPLAFLQDLFTKKQKLNQGNDPTDVARQVLSATPEIRFTALLDSDKIGGFTKSTMTPGKQALFALTLILGESTDKWPLLIDQPEDDLDSRSIYNDIVSFLVKQKKLRQIILVTHNANLVVGADAEEVLVANRQGDDRKNKDGQTFAYLTGSLEYSKPEGTVQHELDRQGIREFAVEILDGGEEAFEKRRDKYKL